VKIYVRFLYIATLPVNGHANYRLLRPEARYRVTMLLGLSALIEGGST